MPETKKPSAIRGCLGFLWPHKPLRAHSWFSNGEWCKDVPHPCCSHFHQQNLLMNKFTEDFANAFLTKIQSFRVQKSTGEPRHPSHGVMSTGILRQGGQMSMCRSPKLIETSPYGDIPLARANTPARASKDTRDRPIWLCLSEAELRRRNPFIRQLQHLNLLS